MTTILVATDLSERSDRALQRAFMLAGELGAEVIVSSVIDDLLPEAVREEATGRTRDRLASHIAALEVARGVSYRTLIEPGRPHRMLLSQAATYDPAVIVLGLHRDRGFLDFFRGTTLDRVTRGGVWPVLLVRDHPDRAYQRVLVAVDFSEPSKRALRAARMLAPKAERRLFHAYTIPFKGYLTSGLEPGGGVSMADARYYDQEARRLMADFMRETGEETPPVVAEGSFVAVLHRMMSELRPDLLAIGRHGRGGLIRAVLGSATEELMSDPPCDMLIV